MYTIRQAAARSGVSAALLRAWERRYGVVAPSRTPGGYRLYDDAAIARLRTMRRLVDAGWSASTAAASVLAGSVPPELDIAGPATTAVPAVSQGESEASELAGRFVGAAAEMDARGIDAVLDEMFVRGSFERAAGDLLFPALHQLGDSWATGEVTVAGEHLASAAVLRRLGLALDAAGSREGRGPRVVVGLPPAGRHELGALAFAVAARRAGLAISYVGPDLPVEDWVAAAAGAQAAVVGVVTRRDRAAAVEVARALRAAHPGLVVAFGGSAAPAEPGVVALNGTLAEAVETLSAELVAAR